MNEKEIKIAQEMLEGACKDTSMIQWRIECIQAYKAILEAAKIRKELDIILK